MNLESILQERSGNCCELCRSTVNLTVYPVVPQKEESDENCVLLCAECEQHLENLDADVNYWHCLNDSIWSEANAVKILCWRVLNKIQSEAWAQSLLDMLYLDDVTLAIAKESENESATNAEIHVDSNGNPLQKGDTISLIKSLEIKGGNFTAKRGITVKNIQLVEGNTGQIEGKINGMQIVILTKFVKKVV